MRKQAGGFMQIRALKQWRAFVAGREYTVGDGVGQLLVSRGIAEVVTHDDDAQRLNKSLSPKKARKKVVA